MPAAPSPEDTVAHHVDPTADACGLLALKLEGEWLDVQEDGKTVFHEQWERTDDRFHTGLGFVMSGEDTVFIEHLNIHAAEGGVFYSARIPSQNNGAYVDFRLTAANTNSLVFENKEHDFPQRIVYALRSDDTWKVSVSGPGKERLRTEHYHFRRAGGSPD